MSSNMWWGVIGQPGRGLCLMFSSMNERSTGTPKVTRVSYQERRYNERVKPGGEVIDGGRVTVSVTGEE